MFATDKAPTSEQTRTQEKTAEPQRSATDPHQPQLSVVAIFVTGPGTAGGGPRRDAPAPAPQIAWSEEQEAAYKAILSQVRDRFAEPPAPNPVLSTEGPLPLSPLR